jgi:hypothetical protein
MHYKCKDSEKNKPEFPYYCIYSFNLYQIKTLFTLSEVKTIL